MITLSVSGKRDHPACAGTTFHGIIIIFWDHPRMCGDPLFLGHPIDLGSPRMCGDHLKSGDCFFKIWDHPRMCGDH